MARKKKSSANVRRKGRKRVQAKRTKVDGIEFASGLEAYCYEQLKANKISATYEKRNFKILTATTTQSPYYSSWKNKLTKRQDYVSDITYTPDFEGKDFIIECKGRKNDRYPVVIKMFRVYNEKHLHKTIYEPKTKAQIDEMISLIKTNL